MKIPDGPNGFPTVSPTMIRTYGAAGFLLDDQEKDRGCPRLWQGIYEGDVPRPQSERMSYGTLVHKALWLMEDEQLTPEDALGRVFPPDGPPEWMREALDDITAYMERGASPFQQLDTIATERELTALLYEDEDFGPIYARAIFDWIGIDPESPRVLHHVDYKLQGRPPAKADVLGDVQLKWQAWLARECAQELIDQQAASVITHLDAVKWHDIQVRYTRADLEAWQAWVVAVVRHILRDTVARPVLNENCHVCPIRFDCPEWTALPETGQKTLELLGVDGMKSGDRSWLAKLHWRDQADAVQKLLAKAVKEADAEFVAEARRRGILVIEDQEWAPVDDWKTTVDVEAVHRLLGDRFYDVAGITKAGLERELVDDPSLLSMALNQFTREIVGSKWKRRKVSDDD